ncbi:MAG: hypothetical protein ACTHM8_00750 [Sphingomonas sp.]
MGEPAYPTMKQATAALMLAPPVAALAVLLDGIWADGLAGLTGGLLFTFYVAIVAEIVTAFIGIPTLAVLYGRLKFRLIWCVLAGGLIAAIPSAIVARSSIQPDFASVDGVVTVVNGQLTHAGVMEELKGVMLMAGFGIIAGFAFWAILRLMIKRQNQ